MNFYKNILAVLITIVFLPAIACSQQPTNIPVTGSGNRCETAITVDPANPDHLMATWKDHTTSQIRPGYSFSTNGGNTWSTPNTILNVTGSDPSCAIDLSGKEYYTYVAPTSYYGGVIKMKISTNDGQTWPDSVQVSSQSSKQDKPYMVVDNTGSSIGNWFVTWTDFSQDQKTYIDIAYSPRAGGRKVQKAIDWVSTSVLSPEMTTIDGGNGVDSTGAGGGPLLQSAIPAIGSDGTVYVVYLYTTNDDSLGAYAEIRFTTSVDTFSTIKTITSVSGIWSDPIGSLHASSSPTIAVDPNNKNNIYVAWTDYNNGNLNINLAYSTNEGDSWHSTPSVAQGGSGSRFFPWLTVDSSGVVSLTYYAGNSNAVDVYVAQSYDHGQSFTGNDMRITPTSMNPTVPVSPFEYMGAVSLANGKTLPLWTNFVSNTAKIYTTPYYYTGGTISQTDTIPLGQTAVFAPGSTTKFSSNASLIVNGVLNAQGTSNQPITFTSQSGNTANSWGNIILNGSGASGSNIKYANIQYGNGVQVINVPAFDISYSNFINNQKSVYTYGSYGSIEYNYINSNSNGHGIYLNNLSEVNVNYNTIVKTNNTGVGILYGGGSDGYLWQNDITGCNWGFGAIWNSSPQFYNTNYQVGQDRNNRITHCTDGVVVYNNSYPIIGDLYPSYGHSTIDSNTVDVALNMSYSTVSNMDAYGIYWNNGDSANAVFQVGSGSGLHVNPSNPTDLWASYPIPSGVNPQGQGDLNLQISGIAANSEIPAMTKNKNITVPASGSIKSDSFSTSDSTMIGINLLHQKKFSEAKDYFISYLSRHPDNQHAYVELYDCYSKETANDIISFFNSLPSKASQDNRLLLADLYLRQGDIDTATSVNDAIIADNPNTSLSERATINNAYIALYNEKDVNKAVNIFKAALKHPELSTDMELADAQDAITNYAKVLGKSAIDLPNLRESSEISSVAIPNDYKLFNNYPNPFNPTTLIRYEIPKDGLVTIKIYDILGREIETLVNEFKPAGTYNVTFNASNLASGVYIYQLRSGNFVTSKKLVLMK